jgi:tetratricopeptide (TPR) repeat protein
MTICKLLMFVLVSSAQAQSPAEVTDLLALLQRGRELQESGRHQDSLRLFETALRMAEGMGPPSESLALSWVGSAYFKLRRLAESERALVRCVELRNRLWGTGNELDPNHARILTSLGAVELLLGRSRQAEERFDKALGIWRSVPGGDKDGDFAANLNNIAMLYFTQRRYSDAAGRFGEVVAMFQDSVSSDDNRLAQARSNLADTLSRLGQHDEADRLSSQALADFSGKMDQEPLIAADLLTIRGSVLRKAKRGREAKAVEARARDFLRKAGAHHRVDVSAFTPRTR